MALSVVLVAKYDPVLPELDMPCNCNCQQSTQQLSNEKALTETQTLRARSL